MKRALLISPYFIPSNLACVYRTRIMASHLPEVGWEPIVVCVDPTYYEEPNDPASLALLPDGLRVERVKAWPARICRPLGFGDVSLRAQWSLRRKVAELIRKEKIDLIFATVLPGYTSLVGAWAKRKFGLPFVLDYQDPWVSNWGAKQLRLSKARLSYWLARKLEPGAVAAADALTAVSDETLQTLRERNLLRNGLPVETIPIGADENDSAVASLAGRSMISKTAGEFALAYVGTVTERMLPIVRALFRASRLAGEANPTTRLSLHFIGTSAQPHGRDAHSLMPLARACGLKDYFHLEPRRIGYLDALRSMQDADALLLIGSTDSHYTASKIFPCWLSGKPIVALFHARSTVNSLARELGGVRVITYDDQNGPEAQINQVVEVLREVSERRSAGVPPRRELAFAPYSAKAVAGRYAALFDHVMADKN
jgi:hypothetical protein